MPEHEEFRSGVKNSGAELQSLELEWSFTPTSVTELGAEFYSNFSRGAQSRVNSNFYWSKGGAAITPD